MLINQYYFKGTLNIPNLTGVGIVPAANLENLNWFIATYEPEYIFLVLGDKLGEALINGLKEDRPAEKWNTLKSKLVDESNNLSPIAGYVYYHVERDRLSTTTPQGQVKNKSDNSEIITNSEKMKSAYDNSMKSGSKIRDWVIANAALYPEFEEGQLKELENCNIW